MLIFQFFLPPPRRRRSHSVGPPGPVPGPVPSDGLGVAAAAEADACVSGAEPKSWALGFDTASVNAPAAGGVPASACLGGEVGWLVGLVGW